MIERKGPAKQMVSAGLFGTGALGCIHVRSAELNLHRYPVKNQLIADKIRIHIRLYRIAPSGNSALTNQGVC